MAWEIKQNLSSKIFYSILSGELSDTDLVAISEKFVKLSDDTKFDDSWLQVIDLSHVDSFENLSLDRVRRTSNNPVFPEKAIRILIAPSAMSFAFARVYKSVYGGESNLDIYIVKSEEEFIELLAVKRRC